MSDRHHKRRGRLPARLKRRELCEKRKDATAEGVEDLVDSVRRSRTLGVGQPLPPDVQHAIDTIAGPEDSVLQRILNASYGYESTRYGGREALEALGLFTPTMRKGIPFFRVGHNASHEFYLGVKDGKIYRWSIGEGVWPEDDDGEIPVEEEIREISEEDLGRVYIGHF